MSMTPYTLTPTEIRAIAEAFTWAAGSGSRVRVAMDDGLKFDVGDGQGWTPPMGKAPEQTGVPHGTVPGFDMGCRCADCTAAAIARPGECLCANCTTGAAPSSAMLE